MKKSPRIRVGVLLALAGSVALAYEVSCPLDKGSAYFTGATRVDVSGKLLKQYKCNAFGHIFWSEH